MIETKAKKCQGQGQAQGFKGCGILTLYRKYGLCKKECYPKFILTTVKGQEIFRKATSIGKKKVKDKKDKEFKTKKRELNIGNAMNLADTYFSRYIRLKHSIFGKCTCYTCGIIKDIKDVDNGHYQKREHKTTRYHENNCRPQCKVCNGDTKHNGKQAEFRVNLANEIGESKVSEIELLSRQTMSANYLFFKDTADYYRNKLNELQKELKVKYW